MGEGLEVAQQLLGVEERFGNFPSTLAQDPGSEDSGYMEKSQAMLLEFLSFLKKFVFYTAV